MKEYEEKEEHRIVGNNLKVEGPEEMKNTGIISHKKVKYPKLYVDRFVRW